MSDSFGPEGVYTIWDRKAESGSPVFQARNDNVAKRLFRSSVLAETVVAENPEDFELRRIGDIWPEDTKMYGYGDDWKVVAFGKEDPADGE